MDDWREVEAIWQSGVEFKGLDERGNVLDMSGTGIGFSPMELLLIGLAGCTGVDVASILKKKRQKINSLSVKVRGLRRNDPPKIFTQIEVEYIFHGEGLDPRAVEQAIQLSEEKYCSASVMLGQVASIHSAYRIESQ
jgi:putative redox protein